MPTQPSKRRSFRKQRTVNPPLLAAAQLPLDPTRYNFLYSSSRPACGRPPATLRAGSDTTVTGAPASSYGSPGMPTMTVGDFG
jgi:hypothetical protein